MISYAAAEACLAKMYGARNVHQTGAFRGRLKHLKKLGIPLESAPGRGKKILYDRDHLYQWCFCLELEEFGIAPTLIAKILKKHWREFIADGFRAAARAQHKTYFVFVPQFMSYGWTDSFTRFPTITTPFGFAAGFDVPNVMQAASERRLGRLAIFDVSKLIHEVEPAFGATERERAK